MKAVLAKRKLLHHIEHHQRRDALRVRRQLVDGPPAIARRDRRHPFRRELVQVRSGHRATHLPHGREDRVGGAAFVES